jgi:hypothetical protein
MTYFNKIFSQWTKDTDVLSRNYPYSFANMKKRIAANPEQFKTIRESIEDVSIKSVCDMKMESLGTGQMGSALLSGFIPDIFTDVISFGQRVSIARRDFPVVSQSSNSSFKTRFMVRHDSAGIYREGDEILSAVTKRLTDEKSFVKIADSMVYTRELLEDSPISQVSLDTSMAANKVSQLEDRCLFHEFCFASDSNEHPEFTDYDVVNLCDGGEDPYGAVTFAMIRDAVSTAMLNLTTRQEDSVPMESLRLYISPECYRILFDDDSYRRFDILGASPNFVTGQVPPLYKIPTTVTGSIGYFDVANQWHHLSTDMLLVSTGCAAIRQRADMRMEPIAIQQRQMEGWLMSERIRPYIIQPINFARITCFPDLPITRLEDVLWSPRDLSKTDNSLEMFSISTAV